MASIHFSDNEYWEADSILSSLERNYVASDLLVEEQGGRELIAQIYKLSGKVSEEFKDYKTAAFKYYAASDYADDPDLLESYAERSEELADSLFQPYEGIPPLIRLEPGQKKMRNTKFKKNKTRLRIVAPGMASYPISLANENYKMDEDIWVQGGINYQLEPKPYQEELKRMGMTLLVSTALLGFIFYNQGY